VAKAAKEEITQGVIQLFWQILQAGIGAQSVRREVLTVPCLGRDKFLKG
jgi:hypothetical protein